MEEVVVEVVGGDCGCEEEEEAVWGRWVSWVLLLEGGDGWV